MFTQPRRDRHKEARFLLDCRPRNAAIIRNHTPLPNIDEAIAFVAAWPLWSKIDLIDVYHNIGLDPDSEEKTTFLCHMVHYISRVMQQGDCNAPATIVRAMNGIFRGTIYKDSIIYIDDIIISTRKYKEDVETSRKVLQRLQDEQFWLKESKCLVFNNRLDILEDISTPEWLSADPLEVQEIFDFPESPDKRHFHVFFDIVNYWL